MVYIERARERAPDACARARARMRRRRARARACAWALVIPQSIRTCDYCERGWFGTTHCLKNRWCYSAENEMTFGTTHPALDNLTYFEEQLLSPINRWCASSPSTAQASQRRGVMLPIKRQAVSTRTRSCMSLNIRVKVKLTLAF